MIKTPPSIGFVYLVVVLGCFGSFVAWGLQQGWYERINSPRQAKADLDQYATYLEKVANDVSRKRRLEILKEATKLRVLIDQPDRARENMEKVLKLKPLDFSLKIVTLPAYWESGQDEKALDFAIENIAAGRHDSETIAVLLAYLSERRDDDLQGSLIKAIVENIKESEGLSLQGQIMAFGFSSDNWTLNGKPGFLIVRALPVPQRNLWLKLACFAGPEHTPVTTTVEDQDGKVVFSHVFERPGFKEFELPVIPADKNGFFVIRTDKSWAPSKEDNRQLGVMINAVPIM